VAVRAPLVDDALHLRPVDDAAQIDAVLRRGLGERGKHRPGGDDGRGDPHALPRSADRLGDPVRELLAVPRREPGARPAAVDVESARLLVAAGVHVAGSPELLEVLGELRGQLG